MGQIRSLILDSLLLSFALAAAALLLLDLAESGSLGGGGCESAGPAAGLNATELDAAFRELVAANSIAAPGGGGGRALLIGPGAGAAAAAMRRLGFATAVGSAATACCGLPFEGSSFDFAFSAALDRARVPARVVLEMERVLRPGGVGAVLRVGSGRAEPAGLVKAAAPVAALLRFSDVSGARAVNGSVMVVFKKKLSAGPVGRTGRPPCKDSITEMPLFFKEIVDSVTAGLSHRFGAFWSIGVIRRVVIN